MKLYKAYTVQYYPDGIPFQTIDLIDEQCNQICLPTDIMTFTTEWPVRTLSCTREEFDKRFYRWH